MAAIIGSVLTLALLHLLLYLFWPPVRLLPVPWFVPTVSSFLALSSFCVAYLSFGRSRALGDPGPDRLGMGFLSFGVLHIFQLLCFPSLPGGRAVIATVPSMAAWLAYLGILALSLSFCGLLFSRTPGSSARRDSGLLFRVCACLAVTVALALLSIHFDHLLPVLVSDGHFTGTASRLLGVLLLPLGINAVLAARHYLRSGDALFGYAAISQVAFVSGGAMYTFGSGWYDLWFYLGRIIIVLAFLVMMGGLLADYVALFRREQEKSRELEQRSAELRRSEELFRVAQEVSPDGFTILRPVPDAGGRVVDFTWVYENPAAARLNGTDPAAVTGKRLLELFPDHAESPFFNAYREVAETGRHRVFEAGFRDLLLRIVVVPAGEEIAVLAEDITERKKGDQALRESELRFRSVMDNMSEGMMLFDTAGNIIYQNPASLRLHGFEPQGRGRIEHEELPAIWKAWNEDGDPITLDDWPLSRVLRGERFQNQVLHVLRYETGLEFDAGYNGCPVHDAEGKLAFGFITIRDITEQRRAEKRLRRFFESGMVGVIYWNMDGAIMDANDKFLQMVGYTRDDLREGRLQWAEMTPPEYRHLDEYALAELKGTGVDTAYEKEYIGKDGNRIPIIIGAAMFDEARHEGVAFVLDISKRKRAEEELRQTRDLLEVRVQERTEALSSALHNLEAETRERIQAVEELRAREQMLLQQSRLAAMGEMLGNISHQWRQPLNNLGLILQHLPMSMEVGELTPESLETEVERAMGLIMHMSHTIDDFTTFLHPDKERKEFSLNGALAAALSLYEASLKASGVDLQVSESEQIVIRGHRNEFLQVLMNLFTNARDAFRERQIRSPRLLIDLRREEGRAVLAVTDNAGGIEPGIMDKIFDPYFSTKGPEYGTGIGLFMSKNIIEKSMGGALTVRNTGEGAEFKIEV